MPFIQLQFRRDLSANWFANNPVLAGGEMGIESDTKLFKLGDGTTNWRALAYGGLKGEQGAPGRVETIVMDGGGAGTNYSYGPAFDCGSAT